jgi:hypothetical protein
VQLVQPVSHKAALLDSGVGNELHFDHINGGNYRGDHGNCLPLLICFKQTFIWWKELWGGDHTRGYFVHIVELSRRGAISASSLGSLAMHVGRAFTLTRNEGSARLGSQQMDRFCWFCSSRRDLFFRYCSGLRSPSCLRESC